MISKYKNIIIVVLIIGVGLIAYSLLKPDPTAESLLETTERQNSTQVLGDEITAAINQINSLKLDRSVLDDPVLLNLRDHSKPINPEPVGRINPFTPINYDSRNVVSTTTPASFIRTSTTTTQATTTTGTTSPAR